MGLQSVQYPRAEVVSSPEPARRLKAKPKVLLAAPVADAFVDGTTLSAPNGPILFTPVAEPAEIRVQHVTLTVSEPAPAAVKDVLGKRAGKKAAAHSAKNRSELP